MGWGWGNHSAVGIDLLRRLAGSGRAALVLPLVDVVAGKGPGVDLLGDLDMEHHEALVAEAHLAADQVGLPHAAEALVVDIGDLLAVAWQRASQWRSVSA